MLNASMPVTDDETDLPLLQQQAIEWLMRLRTRELTDAETRDFAEWLSCDVYHAEAFAEAERLFDVMTQAAQLPAPPLQIMPEPGGAKPVLTAAHSPRRKMPSARWLVLPLSLAAAWLFAVVLVLPEQADWWSSAFSDYHTGTGEQRTVTLSDGSRMLLNTDTAVSVNYRPSLRQITLHHGQALFTVAEDSARPYQVDAGDLSVRALGTVFEVYRKASGDVDVVVEEHAVAVSLKTNGSRRPGLSASVEQGRQLRYVHGSGRLAEPESADNPHANVWTRNQVAVNDRPLAELIAEIARYRTGRVFLANDLKNLRVTGLFSMADPDAALEKVRGILQLKATRLGPWWVFLHR